MNRKKLMYLGIGIIGLMILVNFSSLAVADSTHQNFDEWVLTTETDYYNLQEIDASSDNNYRNYYQLFSDYQPYTNTEYPFTTVIQPIIEYESTNEVNYGFTQSYFTFDNDSFESDNGHYEANITTNEEFSDLTKHNTNQDSSGYFGRVGVIEFEDDSNSDDSYAYDDIYDKSGTHNYLANGTFEYWYLSQDATYIFDTILYSDSTEAVNIRVETNKFQYYDSGWNDLIEIIDLFWYHIRIDFDCETDTFDFYLNNNSIDTDLAFDNSVSSIDNFKFITDTTDLDYYNYIDAIGYYNDYQEYQPIPTEYYGNYTFDYINLESSIEYNHTNACINFTDDTVGLSPSGWTNLDDGTSTSVIKETENGFSNVLRLTDTGANPNNAKIYQDFTAQVSGTVEMWFQVEAMNGATVQIELGTGSQIRYRTDTANDFQIASGGYQDLAWHWSLDTWTHFRIDFDCETDVTETFIDGVSMGTHSFNQVGDSISRIMLYTMYSASATYDFDSIDYSWSSGYFLNRNRDFNKTNIYIDEVGGTVQVIDDLDGHKNVLELHDTSASYRAGMSSYFSSKVYGRIEFYYRMSDASKYCMIEMRDFNGLCGGYITTYLNELLSYSGGLYPSILDPFNNNQWYHFNINFSCITDTFGITIDGTYIDEYAFWHDIDEVSELTIESYTTDTSYYLYVDALDYNWTSGYYENRNLDYDNTTVQESDYQISDNYYPTETGNNRWHMMDVIYSCNLASVSQNKINVRMFRNSTLLSLMVIKWDGSWDYDDIELIYNSDISFNNIEIQTHSYYGVNSHGFTAMNYKVLVFLDNNETAFIEYDNYVLSDGNMIELESYTYYGIAFAQFGTSKNNYVVSCLRGDRILMDDVNSYTNFVNFPIFDKDIAISPYEPDDSENISTNYWPYNTYVIQFWYNDSVKVGDLEVDYNMIQVSPQEAKFYYRLVGDEGLTNWGFIGEWNWLRDALVWIVNILVMIPVQFLLFCLTVAFNFIIMYLIVGSIVVFFWNILLRGLIYLGLLIVWGLMFLYEAIIMPFFAWMLEIGIPLIVDVLILVWAIVLASFIWLISLGTADYEVLFNTLVELMSVIADYVVDIITYFITHLPEILLYASAYVMLVFFIYMKKIYCKARGYRKRTESLEQSLATYMIPITIVKNAISGTMETIPVI